MTKPRPVNRRAAVGKADASAYPCCADGVCPQHQQMKEMSITRRQAARHSRTKPRKPKPAAPVVPVTRREYLEMTRADRQELARSLAVFDAAMAEGGHRAPVTSQ